MRVDGAWSPVATSDLKRGRVCCEEKVGAGWRLPHQRRGPLLRSEWQCAGPKVLVFGRGYTEGIDWLGTEVRLEGPQVRKKFGEVCLSSLSQSWEGTFGRRV